MRKLRDFIVSLTQIKIRLFLKKLSLEISLTKVYKYVISFQGWYYFVVVSDVNMLNPITDHLITRKELSQFHQYLIFNIHIIKRPNKCYIIGGSSSYLR